MDEHQEASYAYLRVRIRFTLETVSPLHCGDGGTLDAEEWPCANPRTKGRINSVCMVDRYAESLGERRPYIPGSTIRGSLRERGGAPAKLFGIADKKEIRRGLVSVHDALRTRPGPRPAALSAPTDNSTNSRGKRERHAERPKSGDLYWNERTYTTLRDGVSLDPITGTAREGLLFAFEVVPAGTRFEVVVEAQRIEHRDLAALLGLVEEWRTPSEECALGKGRGKGWGQIQLHGRVNVELLDAGNLRDWLASDDEEPLPFVSKGFHAPAALSPSARPGRRLGFELKCDCPLLVNDPGRVQRADKKSHDMQSVENGERPKQKDHKPALVFLRTLEGDALIPGSTLRGALRARAKRILMTIAHSYCEADPATAAPAANALIGQLFGEPGRRSLLWISDAHDRRTKAHPQVFTAVDRFTGAVAQEAQKIYSVEAAQCELLEGHCSVDLNRMRIPEGDWWKGLLLLLVRDLMDGELAVGWGKSRGYGRLTLSCLVDKDQRLEGFVTVLAQVRAEAGEQAPKGWLAALHEHIQHEVDSRRSSKTKSGREAAQ